MKLLIANLKKILFFSIPLFTARFLYASIDLIIVTIIAQLGITNLAASALVSTFMMVVNTFCGAMTSSVCIVASYQIGANDKTELKKIALNGMWLSVFISLPIIFCMHFASYFFSYFKQPTEIVHLAQTYLNAMLPGMAPYLCGLALQQFIIGIGNSKISLITTLFRLPLVATISYILIYGKLYFPALGIAGVGWAWTITNLIIFTLLLTILHQRYNQYSVIKFFGSPNFSIIKKLYAIGWPLGMMMCIEVGEFLVNVILGGTISIKALGTYQVSMQLFIILITITLGLGQGILVLTSQALGAKNRTAFIDLYRAGITLVILIVTIASALVYYFTPFFKGYLFWPLTLVLFFTQIIEAIRITYSYLLRGMNDTHFILYCSVIAFWLIALPLNILFVFYFKMGILGIWCGTLLGVITGLLLLLYRFQYKAKSINILTPLYAL